jgi:hypothetical protein
MITCYEAGPLGYSLHRQLTAMGVANDVIRRRNWDNQHTRVKCDQPDLLFAQRLRNTGIYVANEYMQS